MYSICLFSQESESIDDVGDDVTDIPRIITYVDSAIVEQREVYNIEDIQKSHAESIVDFFQSVGMQILSYGAYGLESKPSIRGFTDETVRVVIDGICVNNAQYGTFDFTTININNIERIEIVRGGFTEGISDEGAVGGVIYITTKQQLLGQNILIDSSVKSFLNKNVPLDSIFQNVFYSGQLGENSFLKVGVKYAYAQNEYQYKNYKGSISSREDSSVKDGNADVSFSHFFSQGSSFTLSESFYAGAKDCPGTETSKNPGNQKDFDNRLSLGIINPDFNNIQLENNISWLSNNRYYADNAGDSEHFVNTFTYAGYANFYKYQNFQEGVGLTLSAVYLDSTDDGEHVQFSGTLKETTKIAINTIFSISIPLAVKFCGENIEFIPKLGLRADTHFMDFILSGYRMVQFPNMDDLYWDSNGFSGNKDLDAEDGWGSEFTLNVHDVWFPFSFCVYTNYYKNKIQWSSQDGVWMPRNIASAFYLGFNLRAQKSLFNELFVFKGNVEYLYTELLDSSNSLTYKKRIMWTPDLVYSFLLTLNLKNFSITLEDNYIGKRYKSNMNISYMEPYFLLNINAEFTGFDNATPYLRIENLLDADYEAVDSYPMPGISILVGARFNL